MKTKARKVGDGWRVNADGSFAFKRTRLGTIVVSGTVRRSRRKRRTVQRERHERAVTILSLFPFPIVDVPRRPKRVRLL